MIKTGNGITCPVCGNTEMMVVDSRAGPGYVRRRRKCSVCPNERLSTVESVVPADCGSTAVLEAARIQQAICAMPEVRRELVLTLIRELGEQGAAA